MNPSINTPLHEHPLEQVNPMIVYQNYQGHWRCDNCHKENSAHSYPYHCRTCAFDLCPTCVQGYISLAHRQDHPMFYLDSSRICCQDQNGTWKCAVCKNTNNALRETFSYHCPICRLDICRSCFQPQQHPIHIHELKVVDTSLIYAQTGGNWFCDVCSRPSRASEKFSHHCAECEFDVCRDCFEPHTTPLHEHPLVKADSHNIYARFNGGWRCDHCDSVHNSPTDNNPWHCVTCDYDLCDNCMGSQIEAPDVHGPSAGHVGRNRGFDLSGTLSVSSNRQPSENPWLLRRHLSPPSSPPDAGPVALPGPSFTTERGNAVTSPEEVALYTDDSSKCIICMEQPKNATLIHGDTGHCATCWLCAQVLKQRGDPCPICRAPIEKVIRQFNA